MQNRALFLSLAIAFLMIVSGTSAFVLGQGIGAAGPLNAPSNPASAGLQLQSTAGHASAGSAQTSSPAGGLQTSSSSLSSSAQTSPYLTSAQKSGVPLKYVYIPAAATKPHIVGNVVAPGYLQSPAPFGIGAYGIKNVSGNLVPYSYTTTGFSTTMNVSSLALFDVNSYDPTGMTAQLNTVLTNATIQGVTGYTYWTQNVMFYDNYAHQFEMIDNIWNFSSPSSVMPAGTILNSTAPTIVPYPYAYIGVGPVVNNISTPFVATLSLESAVVLGVDTVYFNYTINYTNTSTGLRQTIGGVFDRVMFNSASGVLGYVPPVPVFRVDGGNVTPTGFIPYDAEVTFEGPGGGSQINVAAINATARLNYLDAAGKYVNVPSSYDIGSETGETSTGIAVAWQPSGLVTLSSGPSLVYGMWNVSASTGTTHYTGSLTPSNAFMFVSPGGSINMSQYGYVPMTTTGDYSFWLPTGSYYQEAMMSSYSPEQGVLTGTKTISLSANSALGVYTPLYALDNAQVKNLSSSGTGALKSPYLLLNKQPGYINPLFGAFNDYGFPVFDGVMIANTNAYVDLNNTPSFAIQYEAFQTVFYLGFYGMPSVDYLGFVFYNTSNLSVYNASLVTGGQAADYFAGFYNANMMFWNSTNDLVANSTFIESPYFPSQISLLFYNPQKVLAGNVLFGNHFLAGDGFSNLGLWLSSSGNLIFNNYFGERPHSANALTPTYDLYTSGVASYQDKWNVSSAPASTYALSVNGYTLSGNIVGNSTMGGNYWTDYAPGSSPYPFNEFGLITSGGDYLPVVLPGPYYPVVFDQIGLPAGHAWSVTMGGLAKTSTTSTITFMAKDGSYNFAVQTAGNYLMFSSAGGITVTGGISNGAGFLFLPYYIVTVNEQGLPPGYAWYAATIVNGNASVTNTLSFDMIPGMWALFYGPTGDYYYFPSSYSYGSGFSYITVNGNMTVNVLFTPILSYFTLYVNGASATDTWSFTADMLVNGGGMVNMGTFNGTGSSAVIQLPYAEYQFNFSSTSVASIIGPGPYIVDFAPPGYYSQSWLSISVTPATTLTFNVPNLPPNTTWIVYGYSFSYFWYGQAQGIGNTATLTVPLDTISYQVVFSNPQYKSVSNSVIVNGPTTVSVPVELMPNTPVTVTFNETGLAAGAQWQVTLNGATKTSTSTSIAFATTTGSEYYQIYSNGSTTPQSSGTLNVQGNMYVGVTFYPKTYSVTFIAAGLPSGQSWTITFNGNSATTTNIASVFSAAAGTFSFSVANITGYKLASNTTSVSINGNTTVLLQFKPLVSTTTTPASSALLDNLGFLILGLAIGGAVGFVALRYLGSRKKQQ